MERYLLKYLKDNAESDLAKKYIDYLKVNLDCKMYAYGDNMRVSYPEPQTIRFREILSYIRALLKSHYVKQETERDRILSFVRMPSSLESKYNLEFASSILNPICFKNIYSNSLIKYYLLFLRLTRNRNFNKMIDDDLIKKMQDYESIIIETYQKYKLKGLIVPNGEPFLYNLHLDLFKEMQKPSFIVLHGIPGIYDLDSEKKADYLLVWGEQIKQNYIDVGFDKDRIKVIGHPRYTEVPQISKLRNSLDDVLVATTGSTEWSPHGWEYDKFPLFDRNILLLYCYSVETVLKRLGVKHARLRAHPSVGREWLEKFIDLDFYVLDINNRSTLTESLNKATLVIGPTSTVWLESILTGVNYIVYEPGNDIKNLKNEVLVPPFDGSDSDLKVAFDEYSLYDMIKHGYQLNTAIVNKYIEPFNFEETCRLFKNSI